MTDEWNAKDRKTILFVVIIAAALITFAILFRTFVPRPKVKAPESVPYDLHAGGRVFSYNVTDVNIYNNHSGGNEVSYSCSDGTEICFENGVCVVEKTNGITDTYDNAYMIKR